MIPSEIPGEKLIVKLWDTICDKGIGGLLRPWQMKREGRAAIEVRRQELLVLAQTERDAEAIRRGEMTVLIPGEEPRLLSGRSRDAEDEDVPASRALLEADAQARRNVRADAIRKEVALARAVLQAEEELARDTTPPPEATVNDDWLLRWRDYASGVASEDLQRLWGKVLAGEIKSPGKFSYRTLEFIRNLTQNEAKVVERIAPFVVGGAVYRINHQWLDKYGVPYADLVELQDIGILNGVDSLTMSMVIASQRQDRFEAIFPCNGHLLLVTAPDASKKLELPACGLTSIGKQVLTLGSSQANSGMLRDLGQWIKGQGYEVQIGRYAVIADGKIQAFDMTPI